MQTLSDLGAVVDKFAAAIPDLNLDGDELEEYSTMLLWLQNQVETGESCEAIVSECLAYFRRPLLRCDAPTREEHGIPLSLQQG